MQLSSLVAGRVTKLPHIGAPDQSAVHTHEVVTQVVPRGVGVKPDVVPLWVVVLSACAGALILMLLVYLLYKVRISPKKIDFELLILDRANSKALINFNLLILCCQLNTLLLSLV